MSSRIISDHYQITFQRLIFSFIHPTFYQELLDTLYMTKVMKGTMMCEGLPSEDGKHSSSD